MKPNLLLKKTALMLALTGICASLSAEPITREQAQKRAEAFLQNAKGSRRLAPVTSRAKLGPRRAVAAMRADLDLYYVFNRGENEGYVIASGDDQTLPVLGYTDSGQFDYDRLPDNMRSWLKDYENQLAQLREHPELMASAPRYAPLHDAIEPMITTKWNQGPPYNDECPMYFNQGRSVTGCVATAFAQVLNYWGEISVTETQADMPAYQGNTEHATLGKLNVPGIPAGSPIDWANMLDTYSGSATGIQEKAVAQLMHYCGVSVQMDYTNSASGAQSYRVAEAAVKYFGYGNSVRYVQGSSYTNDGWDALLYAELAAGRPFYLSGANSEGGHAFVCDGYDGNRCYHINWGWGGQSDGFFLLSSLNPSSQGIGGSGDGYSSYPEAVIGMQPPVNADKEMSIANSTAKRLCLAHFDTDGNGKLSYAEVQAVTDLGTIFKGQRIAAFTELYNFTGLTTLPDSAFAGCTSLASIRLPKQLTHIGKAAFSGCKALKNIALPEGLRTIADDAFNGCVKLANFTLPQSLVSIGQRAFSNCANITATTLPIGIQFVGSQAYAGCTKLSEVTVKSMLPQDIMMATDAFDDIDLSEVTLSVPQGIIDHFLQNTPWNTFGHIRQERNLAQGQFAALQANQKVFLYNVGTGRYLTRGEAYGTQAVVAETNEPMVFELRHTSAMGTDGYALFTQEFSAAGNYMFRTSNDGRVGNGVKACFVDGSLTNNGSACYWKVNEVAENTYTFQTPKGQAGYKENEFLGINTAHASNEASPTYGAYSDVNIDEHTQNCLWMMVAYDEARMELFMAANALENLIRLANTRRITATREQAVLENMDATMADIQKAQRTLRKRMGLISFADDNVRRICAENWDTNSDGELNYTEVKFVDYFKKGIGFDDNSTITSFDEMKYFTNAEAIFYQSFRNCTNLRSVTMPDGIGEVASNAFAGCKALQNVSFGSALHKISDQAFANCTALREMRLPVADPATIEVDATAFRNCKLADATLYVPIGSRQLYAAAPIWKDFGNIEEMRTAPKAGFAPLKENETVYVYNVGTNRYLTRGEAYGTQAVVGKEGLRYQVKRTANMKEGQYYLEAQDLTTSGKVLFRTSSDSKVGKDVRACFVDGQLSAKAYWQVAEVEGKPNTYTFQAPEGDAEYAAWLYLGTQYDHETNYSYYGTDGVYYDVVYDDAPANCQWAFVRLADIEAIEAKTAQVEMLQQLLGYAHERGVDAAAEQAVYDDLQATDEAIDGAIGSLRQKLHYIEFVDSRAKTICVNNWDDDEDDELSLEEAAAVTSLGNAFRTATGMKYLEQLRHFTALTALPAEGFKNSSSLRAIYVPEKVTEIGKNAFTGCSLLKYMVLLNPTQVVEASSASLPTTLTVFVPAGMVAAYQADEHWSKYDIKPFTGQPVVQPEPTSRQYGRANPDLTFVVTGAPIDGEPVLSCEAVAASPVGDYDILVEPGTIALPGVQLLSGTLTVERAPLTITANSFTRNIGEPNPEFTVSYRSFRNREKADVLIKQPTIQCDATPDSPGGVYEIRVFGAEAQNYEITYVNGTLTVVDPIGIDGIRSDKKAERVVDLAGRELKTDAGGAKLKRGIYIVGKKKVLVADQH